jgi:hypothetical protein
MMVVEVEDVMAEVVVVMVVVEEEAVMVVEVEEVETADVDAVVSFLSTCSMPFAP